ncbi:unnamed protein product [Agarophyton chilense]
MRHSFQKPEANVFIQTHNLLNLLMIGGVFGREMEKIDSVGSGSLESRAAHSTSPGSSDTGDVIQVVGVLKRRCSARCVDGASMIVTGSSKEVGGEQRILQVVKYAQTILPVTAYDVNVSTPRLFLSIKSSFGDVSVRLKSQTELIQRERQGIYPARQRCWVAPHFGRSDSTSRDEQ